MKEGRYKSYGAYLPYRERLFEYTGVIIPLIFAGIFILIPIIFGIPSTLKIAFFCGGALWLIVFSPINYFLSAKDVRFYLDEISIDKSINVCYVKYYDKDILKKEQIALEDLQIKLETIYSRGGGYKVCIYNNKNQITFQLCGVEYWSKEICEEIVKTYTQIRKENLKQDKNIK